MSTQKRIQRASIKDEQIPYLGVTCNIY